ncbi:MAG: VWA domain-containing protein, partial [Gammaproteobacteria bacterium]|nr:VWA domain-containing protein [Gammaproteobacteria bacterium]
MKNNFQTLSTFLLLSSLLLFPTGIIASDSAIVVFDGSGSMRKKVDGKPKFEIAQEVMGNLVKDWNEDIKLGLMVYGHRSKSCDDIEMVIPVGSADPKQFIDAIKKINPKGETPIAESLKQAAEKLNYIESPTTIILISDGEESCHANPCAMAKELEKKGINFTAHVIGFDISGKKQARAQEQLKCIAKETGGKFFEAKDSEGLKTALAETAKVIAKPEPTVKKKLVKITNTINLPFSDNFEREELGDHYEIIKL